MNKNSLFIVLFILVIVAIVVSCSFLLSNLNQEDEIDPVCKQRAMDLIGENMVVNVFTSSRDTLNCEYVFPHAKVELEGTSRYDRSCTVHWGNKKGENTNWLHGGFFIGRKFDDQIVDDNGFILGNDKFIFGISVIDIATYFVKSSEEVGDNIEITIPISEQIVFEECNFVT